MKARIIKNSGPGQAAITSQATQSLDAKDQADQKRRKEAGQARVQRENCAKARSNLSTLQNSPRVYITDTAGQRACMDAAARARELANSQKTMSDCCK